MNEHGIRRVRSKVKCVKKKIVKEKRDGFEE